MLNLCAELLDVPRSVFSVILRVVRLLTATIVILLCYLVEHADLAIQLLDRSTARRLLAFVITLSLMGNTDLL